MLKKNLVSLSLISLALGCLSAQAATLPAQMSVNATQCQLGQPCPFGHDDKGIAAYPLKSDGEPHKYQCKISVDSGVKGPVTGYLWLGNNGLDFKFQNREINTENPKPTFDVFTITPEIGKNKDIEIRGAAATTFDALMDKKYVPGTFTCETLN